MTINQLKARETSIREEQAKIEMAFAPYSRLDNAEYIRQTEEIIKLENERLAVTEMIATELLSRHLNALLGN